jgi:hypothetical protein
MSLSLPKLDPKEEHFRIASSVEGLTLFLRYLPPNSQQTDTPKIVLYVHGGSFPSALSCDVSRLAIAAGGWSVGNQIFRRGVAKTQPVPKTRALGECPVAVSGHAPAAAERVCIGGKRWPAGSGDMRRPLAPLPGRPNPTDPGDAADLSTP